METMQPEMLPAPGQRARRFVGDRIRFVIRDKQGRAPSPGWKGVLRTNLGRAASVRREILSAHTGRILPAGYSWRDIPMIPGTEEWSLELTLAETGFFSAKSYLLDSGGRQHWPDGPDFGISVHPDCYRTGNVIYVGFARLMGRNEPISPPASADALSALDRAGYHVLPPSGTFRDLKRQLPHIFERLGCRILHLLPINPTPTTYARFGRFGSPYAALDLAAVDPALIEFDKRTTGIEQFQELADAVHTYGARLLLDIVINHTGWGSNLQERHPEWFLRNPSGEFKSPGAWGVTWEDLVELKHQNLALWDRLADVFITWCDRGVDGFRCDAGYMVPVPAWQYIVAKVQERYPDALFLLEGLGGAWEATEALLTQGRMQWAYSELFQNYSGAEVASCLDHSFRQNRRVGLLVHYSETHDNNRLAASGRAWSLMRNHLCALASENGGFGFMSGVEWLAQEKIRVHERTSLNWDSPDNLVEPLGKLNRLLANHPCFFDGAKVTRISPADSPVLALLRESGDRRNRVLALINLDSANAHSFALEQKTAGEVLGVAALEDMLAWVDLLDTDQVSNPAGVQPAAGSLVRVSGDIHNLRFTFAPGQARVLSAGPQPVGLAGTAYRDARARAALAIRALSHVLPVEDIGPADWRELAAAVEASPKAFLAVLNRLKPERARQNLLGAIRECSREELYPEVVVWTNLDAGRVTPVPAEHWLLIEDPSPFRVRFSLQGNIPVHVESAPAGQHHVACIPPQIERGPARLLLRRHVQGVGPLEADLLYVGSGPDLDTVRRDPQATDLVLLTNGRGGMARICVDLGRVNSKYDCVLGANLHPELPVDRHVLAKRIRVWVSADGFISPLDADRLERFEPGPPAKWHFVANAGDGRTVQILVSARMLEGRNTTLFEFSRPTAAEARGKQLPADADVRLTIRLDIEDRSFHSETRRNPGADHHFSSNTRPYVFSAGNELWHGFEFTPAADRQLRVFASRGEYHAQEEWSHNIPHPNEQSRGQVGSGDAMSPGWFEAPLVKGADCLLVVSADAPAPSWTELSAVMASVSTPVIAGSARVEPVTGAGVDAFETVLARSARAFVVRRGAGSTVIAGYPWFLDWGRDTFIAARGLISAGWLREVAEIVLTFARFEEQGTLPNTIFGEDASNRDTVDAPLWFGLVCEELAAAGGAAADIFSRPVGEQGRTVLDVIESIARHYQTGTPNGIHMDPATGLIWSPAHFTWMDTNYPACTPRQGYPIEIQALWIRLLRLLARVGRKTDRQQWNALAELAFNSVERLFWIEEAGYYSDVLQANGREPASQARVDDALRSNYLFLISLGLMSGGRAWRSVQVAARYLVVPGALRSLAPLPVKLPLVLYGPHSQPINNPTQPYWGRYQGDEDTRRKPAYHNGTAWVWTFPVFCEALARAWHFSPSALAAARAYLGSTSGLLLEGCLGHLPEILDGDAPHAQRGCDAQAWSATETLRVWRLLKATKP